jgi:FtsH-binding integral membrane protein
MLNPPFTRGYAAARAFSAARAASTDARLPNFMARLCAWMAAGLALTGIVAHLTDAVITSSPATEQAVRRLPITFVLALAVQFGFVFVVSGLLMRLQTRQAIPLFLVYAAVNGLWIAGIFLLYASVTVDIGLYVAAGMFALLAVLGYAAKVDLLKAGSLFLMALIGGLLATGTNLYLHGTAVSLVVNYGCVAVFVLLIVYDRERLTWLAIGASGGARRVGILGALLLYLDLLNIVFLALRRRSGQGRG